MIRYRYQLSSADTAARFLSLYVRPAKNDNFRPRTVARTAKQFRADVLAKLGCHVPKFAKQIRQELLDDIGGPISEMRVYRALVVLIKRGQVRRTPDGYVRRRA